MRVQVSTLPFQVQVVETPDAVTGHAGVSLLIETFRGLGIAGAVKRFVGLKERRRGYTEGEIIETLIALMVSGGDCLDDVRVLSADMGLKRMWGRKRLPSPECLRSFLNRFHDEGAVAARVAHTAFIPKDSLALIGLGAVQRHLLGAIQKRTPSKGRATLDVDATIIESEKREALPVYDGGTGYQPIQVWWVEQGLWVRSQFRDGNVPAQTGVLEILQESVATLREIGVMEFAVRSDTAAYQHVVLNWLRREKIAFAISADMSPELRAVALALPENAWKPLRHTRRDQEPSTREWAEVEFVPDHGSYKRDEQPDRYLVERVRPTQLPLFADGEPYRFYATVTNLWEKEGEQLLHWARERCGTVEPAHDVLKNELGGGVLPCKRFGANAAWWQIVVLTANLITALKLIALPAEWRPMRPKRLRFLLLHLFGRLVTHGRRLLLRLARDHPSTSVFIEARRKLALAA